MTVSKEVRDGLKTIFLPPIDTVVAGVDLDAITDEQDKAYNAWCTAEIKRQLLEKAAEDQARYDRIDSGEAAMSSSAKSDALETLAVTMLRTRYPADDFESEDVVALDDDGNIIVLDAGDR